MLGSVSGSTGCPTSEHGRQTAAAARQLSVESSSIGNGGLSDKFDNVQFSRASTTWKD